jgi:hypothetical protein
MHSSAYMKGTYILYQFLRTLLGMSELAPPEMGLWAVDSERIQL